MKPREFWISEVTSTGWTETELHKVTQHKAFADKLGSFIHVIEHSAYEKQVEYNVDINQKYFKVQSENERLKSILGGLLENGRESANHECAERYFEFENQARELLR